MWVRPCLVGSSLGRKNLMSSANFVLQAIDPQRNNKAPYFYRIITKNFPYYKVAEGDNYEEMQENFGYLNEFLLTSMNEKKSSKNIAKWLRIWYEENYNSILPDNNNHDSSMHNNSSDDESSENSQISILREPILECAEPHFTKEPASIFPDDEAQITSKDMIVEQSMVTSNSLERPVDITKGVDDIYGFQDQILDSGMLAHAQVNDGILGPDSPEFINFESLSSESTHSEAKQAEDLETNGKDNWWSSQGLGVLGNWFDSPAVIKRNNQNIGLWEIPIQLIALLTYPVIDNYPAKNPSYTEQRTTLQVTRRRRTLLFLTLYVLVVRYASFDLFVLLLFATQCTILFLMKNSATVNMQMAKRTVRQRVNWAKQWAGGFFRKNTASSNLTQIRPTNIVLYPNKHSPTVSPSESPNTSQAEGSIMKPQKRFFSRSRNHTAPDLSDAFIALESTSSPSTAKQKRRFFSKSKGFNSNLPTTIETSDIEPEGRNSLENH